MKLHSSPLLLFATACLMLFAGSADAALVAHWDLDDGGGAVAQDSTANNYDGALINTPTWINAWSLS